MNDFLELFKSYVESEQINWDKIGFLPAEKVSATAIATCCICVL